MRTKGNSTKLEGRDLALFIFECAMAVFYLLFACAFLFPSLFHIEFASQLEGIRVALGAVVGLYGIFRVYRATKKLSRSLKSE
jgi:hypothetical protein